MIKTVYLVIGADKSVRAAPHHHGLASDEIAFAVRLKFPDTWGRVSGTVDVTLPDWSPTVDAAPADETAEDAR